MKEYLQTVQQYKKGEITVFLALISIIVCGFTYVIIDGARNASAKMQIEAVTRMALDSAISEYNKELFQKYGLLFVDACYKGTSDGSDDTFLSHIISYIDINTLNTSNISYLSSEILDITRATDNYYEPLRIQLREYILGDYYLDNPNDYGYVTDDEILNSYIEEHEELYSEILDELADENVCELQDEYYEDVQSEDAFYDQVDREEEFKRYLYETPYDEKLETLVYLIQKDMKETCYGDFDFGNLIYSANVTVYMEGPLGKVYECTRFITLRGGRS